ncbi:MAG: hypothetical protein RQ715_06995 [Methylococcales bacterium]|nr:hypothetical protein [Methylococcales bacterium]
MSVLPNASFNQRHAERQRKRRLLFGGVFLLVLLFPVSVWFASSAARQHKKAQIELDHMTTQINQFSEIGQYFAEFEKSQSLLMGLVDEAERQGLSVHQWSVRSIELSKIETRRQEAAFYLSSIGRDEKQFFIPELVEIRVVNPRDDIFKLYQDSMDLLELTLKGQYYSRSDS